jgi:acetyl-CoA carboxylase carboxyl transferase subunit alpha
MSLQENIHRNFGMPQPNGYRKALRFMKHADKFGLPIVTFVDTPGAFAGKSAEESGQVSCCTLLSIAEHDTKIRLSLCVAYVNSAWCNVKVSMQKHIWLLPCPIVSMSHAFAM